MIISKLQIENFRNLQAVDIHPHAKLNFLVGVNGAGKTSVLEALVVLSRGRSFRTTQAAELIGRGSDTFRVFAVTESSGGQLHRLGLERSRKRWRGRKDGEDLSQLSQLTRSLPLVLMEPDSHLLVSGPPDVRRRYIDWGMFHVERRFLDTWRSFSKALKQRNAALRSRSAVVLDSIDSVMVHHAEQLDLYRRDHCESISGRIQAILAELSPGLGDISLDYERGWSGSNYAEQLHAGRNRDLERGMTLNGPHRADLNLVCGSTAARAVLSRGEQKVLAAALLLSQAELLDRCGHRPVILLDDLGSEFDGRHFQSVLSRALSVGSQVWVTGTSRPSLEQTAALFHVEQGMVQEVV